MLTLGFQEMEYHQAILAKEPLASGTTMLSLLSMMMPQSISGWESFTTAFCSTYVYYNFDSSAIFFKPSSQFFILASFGQFILHWWP
jgi:hypothetical protein